MIVGTILVHEHLLSNFQLICHFNCAKSHINFMKHLITLPS
jgi:hypothetical protein